MEKKIIKDIERELSLANPNNHWVKKCTKVLKEFKFKDWVGTGLIEKPARVKKILVKDFIFLPLCKHIVRYAGGYTVQVLKNGKYKFVWNNNGELTTKKTLKEIEVVIWENEFIYSEPYWEMHKKDWEEYLKKEGFNFINNG